MTSCAGAKEAGTGLKFDKNSGNLVPAAFDCLAISMAICYCSHAGLCGHHAGPCGRHAGPCGHRTGLCGHHAGLCGHRAGLCGHHANLCGHGGRGHCRRKGSRAGGGPGRSVHSGQTFEFTFFIYDMPGMDKRLQSMILLWYGN